MKVHLYTICWNEAVMLPHFFRHYDHIVDRYFVFDDGSTDSTRQILDDHPKVAWRPFERPDPGSVMLSQVRGQNLMWKHSRRSADWVLVCDVDELYVLPARRSVRGYLDECRREGVTLIPALGVDMIGEPPGDGTAALVDHVTTGVPNPLFNKPAFFNPQSIDDSNFRVGRHSMAPVGNVVLPARDELLLLHFKRLGRQRTFERLRLTGAQLQEADRAQSLSFHWLAQRQDFDADWDAALAAARDLPAILADPTFPGPGNVWWDGLERAETGRIAQARLTTRRLAHPFSRLLRRGRSRLPSDFDATRYLAQNPDVAAAGLDAADHYRLHGRAEGRSYKD